jgi:hypothetical protein
MTNPVITSPIQELIPSRLFEEICVNRVQFGDIGIVWLSAHAHVALKAGVPNKGNQGTDENPVKLIALFEGIGDVTVSLILKV